MSGKLRIFSLLLIKLFGENGWILWARWADPKWNKQTHTVSGASGQSQGLLFSLSPSPPSLSCLIFSPSLSCLSLSLSHSLSLFYSLTYTYLHTYTRSDKWHRTSRMYASWREAVLEQKELNQAYQYSLPNSSGRKVTPPTLERSEWWNTEEGQRFL